MKFMHFRYRPLFTALIGTCLILTALVLNTRAQRAASPTQYPASLLAGLAWRDVGPMRGGRTFGVAGHADQPDTFYMGSVGGGVWKTENSGRTWFPISDTGIPIGSIGAIAVAPSNANVVYVGTGESDIRSQNSYGIGMYKSTDAGKTWKPIGLEGTRQIGRVVVDPKDANRVYVAALGNIYGPNPERGVFRSTDGGATWKKILVNAERPNDVGAIDLAVDTRNPRVVYAAMWSTRRPPWSVYAPVNLKGGGLYKSTDGGDTWAKLSGGLPTDDFVGRIGIAIAPGNSNRLWAVVDDLGSAAPPARGRGGRPPAVPDSQPDAKPTGGVFLSDDAGQTWRLVSKEQRLDSRGWYFNGVAVDPVNADRAYIINTTTYMTTDGGKTFVPIKGAPGGDDYHQMWINPKDGNRMVLSSDQGVVVSVDGGKTWSSWYNQPTAQLYHLSADNRFPWWLYGAQQDSGGVAVSTMSNEGTLSFRNWEPACLAGESDTVVPDPKDGNILYGSGAERCDQRLNVMLPAGPLPPADPNNPNRKTWSLPQVFSLADEAMYYANQFVFRTRDRGKTWQKISSDLTRLQPAVPPNLDPVTAKDIDQPMTDRFGVVYAIGPSPLKADLLWVGTDDGLIYVSRDDGREWISVTPPELTPWSKISQIEASHFDVLTAYASVDRHRLTDNKPYIYRTRDGGKTWQNAVAGIPEGAYVNSVKEDPKTKGLLFAATELRVYVSFNDGDAWQPLQNNMPVTSVRDILVHGDDLAIATYGRGFQVMDQMTPLREIAAQGQKIVSSTAWLFQPGETFAVQMGNQNGTPLPKEEPQHQNPPIGVVVYYQLQSAATAPLKLELVDSQGTVRACAASDTPVRAVDLNAINVQAVWEQPTPGPSAAAGMHRFALNPSSARRGGRGSVPQTPNDACRSSNISAGPLRAGDFTVRMTVNGQTYNQPVTVKPDPRAN